MKSVVEFVKLLGLVTLLGVVGVSAAFRTSRVCSIFVDLGMMQPSTPARYSRTTTIDDVSTGYKVDSYSWGRSMSLSVGIRLQTSGK